MATAISPLAVADQIFDVLRGEEARFPFPTSKRTFTVGTFNATTGRFTYSVPTYTEKIDAPKPKVLKGGRIDSVNVVDVNLKFKVTNRKGAFTVRVPGVPAATTSDSDSVTVPIGAAEAVSFTVSSGAKTFESELPLTVTRLMAAAGAFTMPAFPVAIIYAPPPDRRKKNVSQWSVANNTGNTTTVSFTDSQSTTRPVQPQFTNVNFMVNVIKTYSEAFGLVQGSTLAKGISIALGKIAGALGSASATETRGISVSSQHSVTLSLTNQQTVTTDSNNGGPGSGDLIYYLKNVKLAWFADRAGPLRVAVFGHDGIGVTSVGFLKGGGQTDLDPETVTAFLGLDPFVAGGPSATLPADRYSYIDTIDLNGGEIKVVETYALTEQDTRQITTTSKQVQKNEAGFLRWIGLGVTDEESTEATQTHSSSSQSTNTHTVSNAVDLFAQADERYSVEVYCDVIFGTFAYRQVPSSPQPQLKGMALTAAGQPAANQMVTLRNNGRKFTTRTDAQGRYSFHASTLKPGNSELAMGGVTRRFMFAGGMNFDLKP
jgi:hypothetical protein